MPAQMPTSAADAEAAGMLRELRGRYPTLAPGEVWLVGAGPGDPGLLTLDALAGLLQADVIVHDALVDSRVLALARKGVQLEFAGKRGGRPSVSQNSISERLVVLARSGLRVLRLKGGDPFVFGRGGEEMLTLATAGIPFRVIPGITAGLGGLTAAGIPAMVRGVNQAIILATAHGENEDGVDWQALARTRQPIVLYMAMRTLENIVASLLSGGLSPDTPAAIIASATLPQQSVLESTLGRLAVDARAAEVAAPAIVVVGEVVRNRQLLLAANLLNDATSTNAGSADVAREEE
ncbi:MAG TPA: uroporphyrinogen-III C-methyltransferase [Steroidobacteraceae bacterium]